MPPPEPDGSEEDDRRKARPGVDEKSHRELEDILCQQVDPKAPGDGGHGRPSGHASAQQADGHGDREWEVEETYDNHHQVEDAQLARGVPQAEGRHRDADEQGGHLAHHEHLLVSGVGLEDALVDVA